MRSSATAPNILILGASGFIGRHLLQALRPETVLATYRTTPFAGAVRFDAAKDDIRPLLDRAGPFRSAYILFAESQLDRCAQDPERTHALNVDSVKRIVDALQERRILPVFASTDCVFDGALGNYVEGDAADPILTYGRQKRAVEEYLAATGAPYIVARLSKVVDAEPGGTGMLGEWIRAIRDGAEVRCASDQCFSAIDARDAAHALAALGEGAPPGIYHIGGPRPWDRASLFDALVGAVQRHASVSPIMRRCSINDFPQFLERRPIDISMRIERAERTIGFKPRDLEETCAEIARAAFG